LGDRRRPGGYYIPSPRQNGESTMNRLGLGPSAHGVSVEMTNKDAPQQGYEAIVCEMSRLPPLGSVQKQLAGF
jgi:hypothetical protein